MKCIVCGSEEFEFLHHGTRDIPTIDVYRCKGCGGSQLSSFSQIAEGFYEKSGMRQNSELVELSVLPREENDIRRVEMIKSLKCKRLFGGGILDFGAGKGGMLRELKSLGYDVCGVELEDVMRNRLNEYGIRCEKSIHDYQNEKFSIITMFHVIEHLVKPYEVLENIKAHLKSEGELIIETPNAKDALITLYDSEAFQDFTYWGCHVYLYTKESLEFLLKKAGFRINWSRQIQRYPISNHLYWLSKGAPGGQNKWTIFNTPAMEAEYRKILEENEMCDTLLISVSREH